jgi:hypothetical protein
VFSPQSIGNIASTFAWSPLQGARAGVAIRHADARPGRLPKGVEDGTFWSAKASALLRAYFRRRLARADMWVARWVRRRPRLTGRDLARHRRTHWADTAELRSGPKTAPPRMVSRALSFMADPA